MLPGDVRIDRLRFHELRIPFKVAFKHAAAERTETETVWVDAIAADGTVGSGESCPRPYVTGESLESARAFITGHEATVAREVTDVGSLRSWVTAHADEIDANPAAWCALELAILDLFGKRAGAPVETLLSIPALAGTFRYTAVLGDASPAAFHAMAERYWRLGFRDFKVKLSGQADRDREKLAVFAPWAGGPLRVRADANNLWRNADEGIAGVAAVGYPFFAIEEPIGKDQLGEVSRISVALGCPIIVDESCARREQVAQLAEPVSQWLINVRVSKMGGLLRALQVIDAARSRGIGIIVGAQVGETSVLTRAQLTVARSAGDALVAQEGAFGTYLLERDVCDPPLMFGAGGVLDTSAYPMLTRPGLGLDTSRMFEDVPPEDALR